ncbi:MFS transporter [Streptomyces sp. NBC_01283]|uniref:MFS transporter n=1 Tax=Streptomyces sp. NBC_01283 TaxID=2903812 RepID=UPI00352EA0C1|nr:MFS transporter [Streptomyces sp. NBC_01283]
MGRENAVCTDALTVPPEQTEPAPRRFLGAYRRLKDVPGFWRLASIGMASKLPSGMVGLSLLLLVARDHTYGTAGLAVSALAVGQGVTAPLRGRLVDRLAPCPVLLGFLTAYLMASALLVLVVSGGGSVGAIFALAAAMGASAPPVGVMMRSVWHRSMSSSSNAGLLATAMALDSSMMGAALISGPVLASWLSLSVSPVAPFAVVGLLTAASVGLLINSPGPPSRSAPPTQSARFGHWLGPLTSAPLRRLLASDALFVMAVTAVDVVLPIYAREYHAAGFTGLYLGILSIGSVLGSLALGAVPTLLSHDRKVSVLLCVFAAGAGALTFASGLSPLAVLLACPLAGLVIGCTFAALRTTGGDLAPEERITEAMSWLSSLDMVGGALGAALFAHIAADQGSRVALLLVPAAALLAAAIGWNTRGRQP